MAIAETDHEERLRIIALLFDQYVDGERTIESLMENATNPELDELLSMANEAAFDIAARHHITHPTTHHLQ